MTIISAKKRQIGTIESNRDVVGPLKFTAAVYWATENSFGSNQMRLSAADDDNKDNAVDSDVAVFETAVGKAVKSQLEDDQREFVKGTEKSSPCFSMKIKMNFCG